MSEDERHEDEADAGDEAAESGQEQEVRGALSSLHRMSAPPSFGKDVEETIRRRSAGRFFGRRAFGDRVPFELLAIVALVIALIAWYLIRSSDTGSLRYDRADEAPEIAPEAREVVPQP